MTGDGKMEEDKRKALLMTVGGSHAPLLFSLRSNRPDAVVFFASRGSRRQVTEKLIPALLAEGLPLPDHEFVITPDEQDLGASVFELLAAVPKAMEKLGFGRRRWPALADYTGGTKTMSAATVWASSRERCDFSYIGAAGGERTKDGLGVVVGGRELCLLRENPWNKIAYFEIDSAMRFFNQGQYGNAAALLGEMAAKVSEPTARRMFAALRDVVSGFFHWDVFDHKRAVASLGKSLAPLLDSRRMAMACCRG